MVINNASFDLSSVQNLLSIYSQLSNQVSAFGVNGSKTSQSDVYQNFIKQELGQIQQQMMQNLLQKFGSYAFESIFGSSASSVAGGEVASSAAGVIAGEGSGSALGAGALGSYATGIGATIGTGMIMHEVFSHGEDAPKVGATSGAVAGAAIGTCICPGVGTAVGAFVGAFAGMLSGSPIEKALGLGSGKSDAQVERDIGRRYLKAAGLLGAQDDMHDWNLTLLDGSKFDIGRDSSDLKSWNGNENIKEKLGAMAGEYIMDTNEVECKKVYGDKYPEYQFRATLLSRFMQGIPMDTPIAGKGQEREQMAGFLLNGALASGDPDAQFEAWAEQILGANRDPQFSTALSQIGYLMATPEQQAAAA